MGTEASDLSMDAASKKMPSEADAQTKTVKFNVGGRHFEVSRSLFDQHGDTVLGKLISDTWQSDPKKSIFIDRSGDIFAWVLEYLRYGSIELPTSIPRSMFGREMDYYGIVSEDESVVQHETILEATKSIKMNCRSQRKNATLPKCATTCLLLQIMPTFFLQLEEHSSN